jgi:hypothetical protein
MFSKRQKMSRRHNGDVSLPPVSVYNKKQLGRGSRAVMVVYVYSGGVNVTTSLVMPAQSTMALTEATCIPPTAADSNPLMGGVKDARVGEEGRTTKKTTRVVHIRLVHGQRFSKLPPLLRGSAIIQPASNTTSPANVDQQPMMSRDTDQVTSQTNDVEDDDRYVCFTAYTVEYYMSVKQAV